MKTAVQEKPILFSGPMVRAILEGRKTQTRRVVSKSNSETAAPWDRLEFDESKWPKDLGFGFLPDANGFKKGGYLHVPTRPHADDSQDDPDDWTRNRVYPRWEIGDRLWVRETWGLFDTEPKDGPERAHVYYRASDGNLHECRYQLWRPSIHMPRWASRITLEITDIRAERLQEISEEDAVAEGAMYHDGLGIGHSGWRHDYGDVFSTAKSSFWHLWESINGKGSWDVNPWVWAISFRRVD